MGRDRLNSLLTFSKVSCWISDLQKNIQNIEEELAGQRSINVRQQLDDTANLCAKIFNAVKGLQTDLQNLSKRKDERGENQRENDDLVSLVRSTQFKSVRTAYFEAFWRFRSVVHNYEETYIKRRSVESSQQSLTLSSECDTTQPTNTLGYDFVDASQWLSRRHSLDERVYFPKSSTFIINKKTAALKIQHHAEEERNEQLKALERTLVEMRDLFVLFSTLVMEHGSMLNVAETNWENAAQHVATAKTNMKEAHRHYQEANNGRKCCCLDMTCSLLVLRNFFIKTCMGTSINYVTLQEGTEGFTEV
ncbi:hypothetical protein RP20_CCG010722 [Aedes albopictus]|nr:hypothetical protein RP20_CCG010722 [Aedes albopictus]